MEGAAEESEQQKGRKLSKPTIQHSDIVSRDLVIRYFSGCRWELECLPRNRVVFKAISVTSEQSYQVEESFLSFLDSHIIWVTQSL